MSYLPGDQVKRVQRMAETLDQKREEVLAIQADANSIHLKLEKAKHALDQAREQMAAELVKMDPGVCAAVSARFEPGVKKAS